MPEFMEKYEIRDDIRPLSNRERAWCKRLERALLACPTERLELVTWGDPTLQVIDGRIARKFDLELCDGQANGNEVVLAVVDSRPQISAVTN